MKLGKLPKHLVLFYLWRAAQAEAAAVNHDSRRIQSGVDAEWYLERTGGSEQSFVWLDGRPMFLTFKGNSVTTRGYNEKNGKGTAAQAISKLREALVWFEQQLHSREAAVKHLTEAVPRKLNLAIKREFGPGRALLDAILGD